MTTTTTTLVTFDQLLADITTRTAAMAKQKSISYLKEADLREVMELSVGIVYLGIRQDRSFARVACDIGHRVRDALDLPRDSTLAARTGTFVLESYKALNLIDIEELKPVGAKHTAWFPLCTDEASMSALWEDVRPEKCEALPRFERPEDWCSGMHPMGVPLIKHAPLKLLNKINLVDHHEVISVLNRYQSQGWKINKPVLGVYSRLSNLKGKDVKVHTETDPVTGEISTTFPFSWMEEDNHRSRRGKRLEANSIKRMARKVGDRTFYHMYNCDFRGRIYPLTAFLHEQGSDNAKGLLMLEQGQALGEDGYDWLLYNMANSYGEDKLSREDRIAFTRERIVEFIGFARDPYLNTGWMKADNKWAFLAGCYELRNIMDWVVAGNAIGDYVCHTPVFIDGSNNGVQHLTALSKDESIAHLVNLVPTEKPGDVYAFIATHTWNDYVAPQVAAISDAHKAQYDALFAQMAELKAEIADQRLPKKASSEEKEAHKVKVSGLYAQLKELRSVNEELLKLCRSYYWAKVESAKQRRVVCKRPTMTLGYGGTAWGMGDQILADTKKGADAYFRALDVSAARWMGTAIHKSCLKHLPGPAAMLNMFQQLAGIANAKGQKLGWTVPGTNFPVVQQYRKATSKRVELEFNGKRLQLSVQFIEEKTLDTAKQTSAAAPNVIHSFDAAHLVLTVNACKFPCVTVHDSFGCLPGNMTEMSRAVREQFVAFYALDPLTKLLAQHEAEHLKPETGDLDISLINEAEFAFH